MFRIMISTIWRHQWLLKHLEKGSDIQARCTVLRLLKKDGRRWQGLDFMSVHVYLRPGSALPPALLREFCEWHFLNPYTRPPPPTKTGRKSRMGKRMRNQLAPRKT